MAVNMNFIPYSPLPPKPPKPVPIKHYTPEHSLPPPAPLPRAQPTPEPSFAHLPYPPLTFCEEAHERRENSGTQIGDRVSSAPPNEFDAELQRYDVVEVADMSNSNSIQQDDIDPSSPRVPCVGLIQGSTEPEPKACREVSSDKASQEVDRLSSQKKVTSPFPDGNSTPNESEPKISCQSPSLVDSSDRFPDNLVKLSEPAGSQKQPMLVESDGGIADNRSFTAKAGSEPWRLADPREREKGEQRSMRRRRAEHMDVRVEIPARPETFRKAEKRGDRSDPSDDSDFSNYSDCDTDEAYRESDDGHVTRRSRKRRKLSTRSSAVGTVSPAACAKDPSPTAVIDDMKSRNLKKYRKKPASNSPVSAVTVDETVTKCSGDDGIPVSGFLSSHLSGSKVCYTITFYHEEVGQPLSAKANGLSGPSREKKRSVTTSSRTPFAAEEDKLLKELKEEGQSWDDIVEHFPSRSKATLQTRYSAKLKHRAQPKRNSKPRKHRCC